jgi:membrane dipeptidase
MVVVSVPAVPPIVDTHNDLLMCVAARPEARWGPYFGQRWLPQLREGGVGVQVLPVFVDESHGPEGQLRQALRMVACAHRIADENAEEVSLCVSGAEIDDAVTQGRIALVLALEGCGYLHHDLHLLEVLHRLGVRVASLTHVGRTELADGSGVGPQGGLTQLGQRAVRLMQELGMLVDVSHLNDAGVEGVLGIAQAPVIATHSGARAIYHHHRNLPDHLLAAIAAGGGVVCVNFFAGFLGDEQNRTMGRLMEHIEHVHSVTGSAGVGIGPDFCREVEIELSPSWFGPGEFTEPGFDVRSCVQGLEGPAGLGRVRDALGGRPALVGSVNAVMGGNAYRLLQAL